MKEETVVLTQSRYVNNQEQIVQIIYRATHWEMDAKNLDSHILNIFSGTRLIATHRTWDHIAFGDALVKETII